MIEIGSVYRIRMDQSDGIKPKGTDKYRYKYIIIIGYNGKDYHAAVATNTKDHHLVPAEFQYPLTHNGYKCFVNCFKLHDVSSVRLTVGSQYGKIPNDDLELIIRCVKESPRIPPSVLIKYGIA